MKTRTMSRRSDHPSIGALENEAWLDDTDPDWIKAYEVMGDLVPRFTDIVRLAAGDTGLQVIVRPNQGPMTNGAKVVIPVDIGFANVDPKRPCTCDTSDDCAYHVFVGYLIHEAAHIALGSTKKVTPELIGDVLASFDKIGAYIGPKYAEQAFTSPASRTARVTLEAMTVLTPEQWSSYDRRPVSLLEVAGLFNRHAPNVCNALEDARINQVMGLQRSALDQVMRRLLKRIVISAMGVEDGLGEAPIGYQVAVGMEVKMEHDLDLGPLLKSETASVALADDVLHRLVTNPDLFQSTADCVAASAILTEHLRNTYGLYEVSVDRETRQGSKLKSGKDTGDDGKMKPSQQKREAKELGQGSDRTLSRARNTARADDQGFGEYDRTHDTPTEEPQTRTDLNKALIDALDKLADPTEVDGPAEAANTPYAGGYGIKAGSGEGSYRTIVLRPNLEVRANGDIMIGPGFTYAAGNDESPERIQTLDNQTFKPVEASHRALAEALGLNRRSANVPNLPSGRLHGSKLAKVPSGGRRVFRRVEKPAKRSYAVLIGVDQSGSTHGGTDDPLRALAYGQAELLDRAGIPFAIAGHTGRGYATHLEGDRFGEYEWESKEACEEVCRSYGVEPRGRIDLATIQLIKNFAEPWDLRAKLAHANLEGIAQNLDGITLRAYMNLLCSHRATDRILLYYTDGAMPAEDRSHQTPILEAECRRAKAMSMLPDRRLHLIGVGVGTDSPKKYGLDTIEVPNLIEEGEDELGIGLVVEGLSERIQATINK